MPQIEDLDGIRDKIEDLLMALEAYRDKLQSERARELETNTPRAKRIEIIDFQTKKVDDLLEVVETAVLDELIWLYDVGHVLNVASSDEGLV